MRGGAFRRGMAPLARRMRAAGWGGDFASVDWGAVDVMETMTDETARWQDEIAPFFLTHTKGEIYERALKSRIPALPCNTPREISEDSQLASRGFWEVVDHPELGTSITYPGVPYQLSLTPGRIGRRPPLIGEHTDEVLRELAASPEAEAESGAGGVRAPASKRALEGLKVADFTWVLAGPLTTKSLSDFGATVVKVESGKRLDLTRAATPYKDGRPGPNRSGTFRFYNSSKYSLCLDLSQARGVEVARRLVAWADVVVENFAPGVMEGMGLSYGHLREINPEIVMLSSSNQGQTGPHREHRGFGWNLGGLAGFNHLTGWPDRMGVAPNQAWTDFFSPWFGAVAILGALDYRRRTGKGQYIDLSQYEAGLSFLSVALLEHAANGREPIRQGNRDPRAAPHGAYPCRGDDRWCVLGIFTQDEWRAFSQALGDPDWVRDPRFATPEARKENESELDTLVAAWTAGLTRHEVMARLQGVGVAAGVVEDSRDLLEADPQLEHRGYFQFLDHPEMGPSSHIYWPAHLSLTPATLRCAPLLGEHTEMVCRELLGMSDGEFRGLKASGVLA